MTIPFEPTRSYVYNAARYELLPRIAEMARSFGDEPFLLRDISKRLLAETYSPEQLDIRIKKAKSDATERMGTIFGFYIPFLAENLKVLENMGGGMFRNISIEEEMAEAELFTVVMSWAICEDTVELWLTFSFTSCKPTEAWPMLSVISRVAWD